jgi:Phosphoinositide phospholipase C, Ca2+-dependent
VNIRRAAILVVMVMVAASCAAFHSGGPDNEGLIVTVGPPGAGGDRVVDVVSPRPPADHTLSAKVYLDDPTGAPVASGDLPLHFTLPGAKALPGVHQLNAYAPDQGDVRHGGAFFSGDLRINQIQVLGSHNSYHVAPPAGSPAAGVKEWQYSHDPLNVQFQSEGIRQIELDVYADPNGIRVLHVPDVDFGTTCVKWVDCLTVIKTWSDAHPKHMPITILTELNDTSYGLPTPILPWDGPAMDQLDAEIRSVFPPQDVITPDDVRGSRATLAEAIQKDGWPTINSVRGQVMFVMDNAGSYRDTYTAGHPTLEGREIFTNSDTGRPDLAFIKLNDPVGDATRIHDSVAAGLVTRTRADADTYEARANNTVPRDAAINGGAQWVSTDFEVAGRAYGQPYFVAIPGGAPARCNPINAPSWCTPQLIENLGG